MALKKNSRRTGISSAVKSMTSAIQSTVKKGAGKLGQLRREQLQPPVPGHRGAEQLDHRQHHRGQPPHHHGPGHVRQLGRGRHLQRLCKQPGEPAVRGHGGAAERAGKRGERRLLRPGPKRQRRELWRGLLRVAAL